MHPSIRYTFGIVLIVALAAGRFWMVQNPDSRSESDGSKIVLKESLSETRTHEPTFVLTEDFDLEPVHDFSAWLESYRSGRMEASFVEAGRVLAEQRRSLMLKLTQKNPTAALGASIGFADYESLPEELQELVEQPFTTTGNVLITAICDHDHHTPDYLVDVILEDQSRLKIAPNDMSRARVSKSDLPIQGIQIDGYAALQPQVFQKLEGADLDWAWESLPHGNPDPNADFLTGEPLGPNPLTAVAGGFVFLFSNDETLSELETVLRSFDDLPGGTTGSSILFSEELQTQAKGLPIEAIKNRQKQILINDTTGNKTTIFIRAIFPDKLDPPISKEDLEAQINTDVSGHFENYSYDLTSITATATADTYQLAENTSQYTFNGEGGTNDRTEMILEAIALYEAAGSPEGAIGDFDIVGMVFPRLDSWGSAVGLGTVGGAQSSHWLNGTPSTETIVHEFGHNFGLVHSNYWIFNGTGNEGSTDPVDPAGENEEYGDFWDVMGVGDATRGHFHMAAKNYLGWLSDDDTIRIDAAEGSGTYRVFRFDHKGASGLQMLEVTKSGNENYFIGFRRAFKSNANYYRGAYILWERSSSSGGQPERNQGWIIDTTPESLGERQDAGISLGRTYSDVATMVHITPIGVGGSAPNEYLDVVVNYGEFSGNTAPTVSINIPATGDARTALNFSATGNDADGDDLAYSWDLGNGEVYPNSDTISAIYLVGGTYDVSVTISDMKGGTETQSAQIIIDDPVNIWTTRTSGTTNDLEGLGTDGTTLFAVGRGALLRSTNGQSYTNQAPSGTLNTIFNDVVWTGSEWLAVGLDAEFQSGNFFGWKPVIFSSSDGTDWGQIFEAPANEGNSLIGFNEIASNEDGSLVIVVGDQGLLYKRVDGGDWTKVEGLELSEQTDLGIDYGNGVFVVGGFDFINQTTGLYLFRTSDGENWEDLESNSDLNSNAALDAIAFLNNLFIASGFNSRVVFSENGGLSWQTLEQGNRHRMSTFAFGAGVFYSIGVDEDAGNALVNLVSSDGKLWNTVADGDTEAGNDVIFFNNSFIIVGDGGSIRQSGLVEFSGNTAPTVSINIPATGDARTALNFSATGNDADGDDLAYSWDLGNGEVYPNSDTISAIYLVGGTYDVSVTISDMKGGTETQSAQIIIDDPVNIWTTRTSGTTNDLEGLGTDGTTLFAVGRGALLRSTNGQSYTNQAPSGTLNTIFNDVVWTGSEWLAVGLDAEFQSGNFFGWKPVIFSSSDGTDWGQIFEAPANEGNSLIGFNEIASNEDGSLVIVVGDQGLLYKRVDGGDWTKVEGLELSEQTDLGIDYGNGVFVVGGFDFINQTTGLYLFRTSDGENWEDLESNSDLNSNAALDAIAFLNNLFIASGFNSRVVFSENGGLSWQTLEQGNRHRMSTFAFGAGVFYSIGVDEDAGNALVNLVSSDGKLWNTVADGDTEAGNDVIFFNNSFIIVGDGGSIRQSGLVDASAEILATPQISPASQGFSGSIEVSMSTDAEDAEIRYTMDESEPTAGSTLYADPFEIAETTTVKAKVFKGGLDPSVTATATYTKTLAGFAAWIDPFYQGENASATANPDGDWASNLLEWALGSLPNNVDSAPMEPEFSIDLNNGIATFTIHRLAEEPSANIIIEKSMDLANWSELATSATTDTDIMLVLVDDNPILLVPCFLRIRVSD